MIDRDLAELYGVKAIRLREQVKRNIDRFPEDFMFQLTTDEADLMVSQNAIPSRQHLGGTLPYVFVSELVKSAHSSIVLIDNYVDESVLVLLSKRKEGCSAVIYTKTISKQLQLNLKKYNEQYAPIEIKTLKEAHDRFLIINDKEIYHIGASLKDLGKKWFAFSKFDKEALVFLDKLEGVDL